MKRFIATIALLTITTWATAQDCCPPDYSFYLKVGSGVSCAETAHVDAPSPPWNETAQGYDSDLGVCPIGTFSVGCEFSRLVDLEVGIGNRSTFEYRKTQSSSPADPSYKREFDLSVTSILVSANVLGRCIPYCSWDLCAGTIYPTIGFGLGASNLLITNFRTTGLPPSGDSDPNDSFTSENEYTKRRNFTYTVQAGLEYNYCDRFALATGYRWFDAGHFKGPRYIRVANGAAVDVGGNPWDIQFRSSEWFIELKIFI